MPYEGEIADTEHGLGAIMPTAQESDDRLSESLPRSIRTVMLEVDFVQCRGRRYRWLRSRINRRTPSCMGKSSKFQSRALASFHSFHWCELRPL